MSDSNVTIRRLDTCSFIEAVRLWNEGFSGYYVDLTLALDGYLARLRADCLSPGLSLAAYVAGAPAGFLLNGVRASRAGQTAWNGGTGVAPAFRGRGVGRALVAAALRVYRELGVRVATLEAVARNAPAIALYRRFGYEVCDRLVVMKQEGALAEHAFVAHGGAAYTSRQVAPYEVGALAFYRTTTPWQTQWQSVQAAGGRGVVAADAAGRVSGYALFKERFDADGAVAGSVLCQCEVSPDAAHAAAAIVACLLRAVFTPLGAHRQRTAHDLSATNDATLRALAAAGFETLLEQVQMRALIS
jgi:ribosomal protein S18 acetylase RimI-like enzyme